MGVIARNDNQITVFYNSGSSIGKQARAFIESFEQKVLAKDVMNTNIPGTQWMEIADELNISLAELVNKENPLFLKEYGDSHVDFNETDWLKVLQNNPSLLHGTVVLMGSETYHYVNPSDFIRHLSSQHDKGEAGI